MSILTRPLIPKQASPSKAAAVPLPETSLGVPGSPTESHPNPFRVGVQCLTLASVISHSEQQFGMAPAATTGIKGAPSGAGTRSRQAASTKASHKSPSVAENGVSGTFNGCGQSSDSWRCRSSYRPRHPLAHCHRHGRLLLGAQTQSVPGPRALRHPRTSL